MAPTVPVPWPKDGLDYNAQSTPVSGTKRPGQTAHYRNNAFPFVSLKNPDTFTTLLDVFESGHRIAGNGPMLAHRPLLSSNPMKYADHFVWQSWDTIDARRRAVGSALHKLFAEGELGGGAIKSIGIWSQNSPSWQIVDLAAQAYDLVTVSLYDTLGKDAVEYIINHAETSVVFATSQHIQSLLRLSSRLPVLRMIVCLDVLSSEAKSILVSWGQERNIKLLEFAELEALGKANPSDIILPTPDRMATICYTSGTTGNPKGVVLTHGMLANATHANCIGVDINNEKVLQISFLPLAHIYERTMELCTMAQGGSIGYYTGDPLRLLEDMQILKPNFFPSVPRVWNRIYQAGMAAGAAPGLKGALFNRALQTKLERLRTTGDNKHAFWDRLVFSKVQAVLGGNIKFATSGSAPISVAAMEFLRVALACDIIEGEYGGTENCGTALRTWPNDPTSVGKVGAPHVNTEIKLIDVPAMGYTSEDKPHPRGEICTRGDHCFKEYYKDEANTKATVDEEGWVHTGDVGLLDGEGRFKIIDRVKNIMKLAQGEYVALEHVENVYSACPIVAQLFVHGDSLQSYLLAVVVPDPAPLAAIATKVLGTKIDIQDGAALAKAAKDPKVNAAILHELNKVAKKSGLKGFEMIRRIYISLEPLTIENGCLTPTLKIRRKEAYNFFKPQLDALYTLPEPSSSNSSKL